MLLSVAAGGVEESWPSVAVVAGSRSGSVGAAAGALKAGRPNLTPYQPSGWSGKIVVSNVTGTHTDSSALAYTDTLYVDWAGVNNGSAATRTRVYTGLYVDGTLRYTWWLDPTLDPNTYTWANDYSIGKLSVGTHTIQVKLDATKAVAESNEKDNVFTKTITVAAPNLTPYKPAGWSDKIVVSNVGGTSTDTSVLYSSDTLCVDWAGINNGKARTGARFYTELYVDGAIRNTWYQDPALNPNTFTCVTDYSIGKLSVGTHTIQVRLDATGAVAETNESDNVYTKAITVRDPALRPNLSPYKPAGWSDTIVVSNVTGTRSDSGSLSPANTLYIDWAGINNGSAATAAKFSTQLYVDGTLRHTWTTGPALAAGDFAYATDYALGSLSVGQHTIQMRLDTGNAIAETNESDNVYTKTITVRDSTLRPNLSPYKPAGWSDTIVVSNVTGTRSDSGSLSPANTLYLDWAGINNGSAATAAKFSTQLYVDGTLRHTWTTGAALAAGNFAYATDYALGSLSVGQHTIQMRLDTGNAIAETNESDNVYTKTITVGSLINVTFVAHYVDSSGEGFFDPRVGAQRRAAFEYALGIWSGLLPKAYAAETFTIDAAFDPLGGTTTGAVLGRAGPSGYRKNFGGSSLANTWYSEGLANHLARRDLAPGTAEMLATFNSDLDNQTVMGATDWYYGTDGRCGGDSDFVSVVLHEIGHGLNLLGNINPTTGAWYNNYPGIYDRFLEIGNGTDLTAMSNAGRAAAVIGKNLYWSGAGGKAGNGGARPQMFAPNPYQPGSSVSHVDETVFKYDLMSPVYSGMTHTPSSIDLGMLADMGWNVRSGRSAAVYVMPTAGGIASPLQAALFAAFTRVEYAFPHVHPAAPPLGSAFRASILDCGSSVAESRSRLGAVDSLLPTLDGSPSDSDGSPVSAWEQRSVDRSFEQQREPWSGPATLEEGDLAAMLQPREAAFSRKALADRVFVETPSSYLPHDLASGPLEVAQALGQADWTERLATPLPTDRNG